MSEWDDAPMFRVKSRTCFLGKHYTPKFCKGETCRCGKPATHKVEEYTAEPRHPYAAYLCCGCFTDLMEPRP